MSTTYVVPQGWVERYTADNGFRTMSVFHTSRNCARIKHDELLEPATRPGSASRCRLCAAA